MVSYPWSSGHVKTSTTDQTAVNSQTRYVCKLWKWSWYSPWPCQTSLSMTSLLLIGFIFFSRNINKQKNGILQNLDMVEHVWAARCSSCVLKVLYVETQLKPFFASCAQLEPGCRFLFLQVWVQTIKVLSRVHRKLHRHRQAGPSLVDLESTKEHLSM